MTPRQLGTARLERVACAVGLALLLGTACQGKAHEPGRAALVPAGTPAGGEVGLAQGGSAGADSPGAGSDAGPSPVAGATWLGEAGGWLRTETLPTCSTFVAREPARAWPGFSFQPCGSGCRETGLLPEGKTGHAAVLGTAARVVNGDLHLSLSVSTGERPNVFVLGTYAFGEGSAEALVVETGTECYAQFSGRASPQMLTFVPPRGEDPPFKLGWIERDRSMNVRFLESTVATTLETFDFGTSWGRMASRGTVAVADSPLTTDLRTIYQASGILFDPTGAEGLLGFIEWTGTEGKVLAWRQGHETSVVASGSWHPARFGMSKDRFVWIGATGPRVGDGAYETARLYSCKVDPALGPCNVEESPLLDLYTSDGIIAVAGRWAALTGCSESACEAYLYDFEQSSFHRLRRAHADHGVAVIGLSERELFVADFPPGTLGGHDFQRLVRFDLSDLDSIATRL